MIAGVAMLASVTSAAAAPAVDIVAARGGGYVYARADGTVTATGERLFPPSVPGETVVGVAQPPTGNGFWLATSDRRVHAVGDAPPEEPQGLTNPFTGIASHPSVAGYWVVARDGGIAQVSRDQASPRFPGFYGAVPGDPYNAPHNDPSNPVVDLESTPTGDGYWAVDANGRVFGFGGANRSWGGISPGAQLNGKIVGISASPTGDGYWLAGADGGVFSFPPDAAGAPYCGGLGGSGEQGVTGIAAFPSGRGYWLLKESGDVLAYGDYAPGSRGAATFPRCVRVVGAPPPPGETPAGTDEPAPNPSPNGETYRGVPLRDLHLVAGFTRAQVRRVRRGVVLRLKRLDLVYGAPDRATVSLDCRRCLPRLRKVSNFARKRPIWGGGRKGVGLRRSSILRVTVQVGDDSRVLRYKVKRKAGRWDLVGVRRSGR